MTAIKDITKAIVENGALKERTLEETVCINGINYRTDDPDAKQHGVYDYFYEVANPPVGKKAVPNRVIDHAAGTVTDGFLYVDMTSDEIKQATNGPIDQQILASEKQALETGLIRTLIEDLMNRALDQAGVLLGMTLPLSVEQEASVEAMLLDEAGPYFSKPYAKIHANAAERAALRTQRV